MSTARGDGKRTRRLFVQTNQAQSRGTPRSPLLPHERDESPEEAIAADPRVVKAHADVARGLVDTERRGDATPIFNGRARPRSTTSRHCACSGRAPITNGAAMRIATALIILSLSPGSAVAKLPPPTEEAKAQAALAAAKAAWSDKVAQYQLCVAGDRTAERYRASLKAALKEVPPPLATPPCVDPGPFVAEARPLEAAGAHSPPETAKSPPSTNLTAAELAGGVKKQQEKRQ